jgi:uncharacterized protein
MADSPPARRCASWPWRRRIVRLAVLLLALFVLVQGTLGVILVTNFRRSVPPPSDPLLERARAAGGWAAIEFRTDDGLTLRGELFGTARGRPVVIIAHGYRDNRRRADPFVPELLAAGYSVLAFDFRGSGASAGRFTAVGAVEERDVRAAVRFLVERQSVPPARIAVVGLSMGASATALAGPALRGLGAVVLVAPYAGLEDAANARTKRWAGVSARPWTTPALFVARLLSGGDPMAANPVERIGDLAPAPLLVVGGERDWRAPVSGLEALQTQSRQPGAPVVLPGVDHDELCALSPRIRAVILPFLRQHVPAAP